MKKISVIVPVYNVDNYLNKCLDSLVNQTYKNLEIIIVNDDSPDNSDRIIKSYKEKYNNIVYIKNKCNSGLSYSRNVGLKKSTGEYIGFVDSDDYIPLDYYENLYKTIEKEQADIVICDINLVYEATGIVSRNTVGTKDNLIIDFVSNGLAASACNKLFKKECISKYEFENGKINEDIAVIIPLIINSNKVVYNENTCYNYVQRNNSIQNSNFSKNVSKE